MVALWILSAVQAAAGIFVVHARLDARIASRKAERASENNRHAAFLFQIILLAGSAACAASGRLWLAAALAIAALAYWMDLRRQRIPSPCECL